MQEFLKAQFSGDTLVLGAAHRQTVVRLLQACIRNVNPGTKITWNDIHMFAYVLSTFPKIDVYEVDYKWLESAIAKNPLACLYLFHPVKGGDGSHMVCKVAFPIAKLNQDAIRVSHQVYDLPSDCFQPLSIFTQYDASAGNQWIPLFDSYTMQQNYTATLEKIGCASMAETFIEYVTNLQFKKQWVLFSQHRNACIFIYLAGILHHSMYKRDANSLVCTSLWKMFLHVERDGLVGFLRECMGSVSTADSCLKHPFFRSFAEFGIEHAMSLPDDVVQSDLNKIGHVEWYTFPQWHMVLPLLGDKRAELSKGIAYVPLGVLPDAIGCIAEFMWRKSVSDLIRITTSDETIRFVMRDEQILGLCGAMFDSLSGTILENSPLANGKSLSGVKLPDIEDLGTSAPLCMVWQKTMFEQNRRLAHLSRASLFTLLLDTGYAPETVRTYAAKFADKSKEYVNQVTQEDYRRRRLDNERLAVEASCSHQLSQKFTRDDVCPDDKPFSRGCPFMRAENIEMLTNTLLHVGHSAEDAAYVASVAMPADGQRKPVRACRVDLSTRIRRNTGRTKESSQFSSPAEFVHTLLREK